MSEIILAALICANGVFAIALPAFTGAPISPPLSAIHGILLIYASGFVFRGRQS